MRKDIVIIGAGNVGGFLAYNIQEFGDYNVIGFLDDDVKKQHREMYQTKVLGKIDYLEELLTRNYDLEVVIGIANPRYKSATVERLRRFNLKFPSMVSKNSWISKNVDIGIGAIIYPGVSINYETTFGDFVIANMNCAIGHNCTLSDYSTLAPSVSLAGFTFLEQGVDMGINSATIQRVRIGEFSKISGMAMVISDIPINTTAIGVPARYQL